MEEYETVNRIKRSTNRREKEAMVCFSKELPQEATTEIKRYEGWNAELYGNVYNKKALAKFQADMKINRNITQTEKRKKEIQKRNFKK